MNISEMWPVSNIQVIGVWKGHPQINEFIKDNHVSDSKEIKPFFKLQLDIFLYFCWDQ